MLSQLLAAALQIQNVPIARQQRDLLGFRRPMTHSAALTSAVKKVSVVFLFLGVCMSSLKNAIDLSHDAESDCYTSH